MNPEQIKRFKELPNQIAEERDAEKVKLLAAELRDLTTLELRGMRFGSELNCPACGTKMTMHTPEMLKNCTRIRASTLRISSTR